MPSECLLMVSLRPALFLASRPPWLAMGAKQCAGLAVARQHDWISYSWPVLVRFLHGPQA
jgi:hypothetical protein